MEGAMAENRASNWGDISKLGFDFSDFAGAGGLKGVNGLFNKKKQVTTG